MSGTVNEHGKYYGLNSDLLDHKYKGCGNGQIVIDKNTDAVISMDYLDGCDQPISEQNVRMHTDAGEVIRENDSTITYRANFSCCQACLF